MGNDGSKLRQIVFIIIQYYSDRQMDETGQSMLSKLIECILQSRINIQKKQIRHFDEINKQLNKTQQKSKQKQNHITNLASFFNSLLLKDKYSLKARLYSIQNYEAVTIQFKLVNKYTGVKVSAEIWEIQFQQYKNIEEQNDEQQFYIITTLFGELLLYLNRQPLFSQYQRNQKMKNCFILDYELHVRSQKLKQKQAYNSQNITQVHHKHTKQRICHSLSVKIQCYYLAKFDSLLDNMTSTPTKLEEQPKEKKLGQTTTDNSKIKCGEKTKQKQEESSRKQSIYQFYDKELDFVFLASDDEMFKNSPKNLVKEINISSIEDNQQFQLLFVSKDDEFLDDNKDLFAQFAAHQTQYLDKKY